MPLWEQILIVVFLPSILAGVIWNAVWISRLARRLRDLTHLLQEPEKGLNLHDVVTQLHKLANENYIATTEHLRTVAKTSEMVAELMRDQMQQLLVNTARLGRAIDEGSATTRRIETAAKGVADDLAESHANAERVAHDSEAGAAADAAARQTVKEKLAAEG